MNLLIFIGLLLLLVIIIWLTSKKEITLETDRADIIIVGGGTAGCIVARRLSERFPDKQIVVLDRGTNRRNDPNVYNIANAEKVAYVEPYSQVVKTDFPGATASFGKMYGGSSSHNYGLIVKGSPDFYNGAWREQLGLSYIDVQPYFQRIDQKIGITPLPVSIQILPRILPALSKIFKEGPDMVVKAFNVITNLGPLRASDRLSQTLTEIVHRTKRVPIVKDYNGPIGVCTSETPQISIDPAVGLRQSADVAYLPSSYITIDSEGRGRNNNLQLVPNAIVDKITLQTVEWGRGVTKLNPGGRIILAAGAINTPILLQESGFPNPLIGKNMINHYGTTMILEASPTDDESFNFSSGPLAFVPRKGNSGRDWQWLVSGSVDKKLLDSIGFIEDSKKKYFSFLLWDLNPKVRGEVTPGSVLDLNLFEDPDDIVSITDGMRWMFQIAEELKMTYPTLRPVYPPVVNEEYIKRGLSLTVHYCHTCPLGQVVDPSDFSLYGASNIHVVDASVFPAISDGNTYYPVAVMAEVAADRISNSLSSHF